MPADLQSYWLLDRFGCEALYNFGLHLKNQDQHRKKNKNYCCAVSMGISQIQHLSVYRHGQTQVLH
jgi:hypothetical protein